MSDLDKDLGISLIGLDGANPLGFLAALGVLAIASRIAPGSRLRWIETHLGWRPIATGIGHDQVTFTDAILRELRAAPMTAFTIDGKLPFSSDKLASALADSVRKARPMERRELDFLSAFGSEVHQEKNGDFQCSRFRMVRSGDSAGQGLPVYALKIRELTDAANLERTLYHPWDYLDDGFSSLRWDPTEDQRYALRWRDPSKSGLGDGPGNMIAANSLAIEALPLLPTQPMEQRVSTTGFHRDTDRKLRFRWPLWNAPLGLAEARSTLTLPELANRSLHRDLLQRRGIAMVYESERIQQNQYYSNFAPAIAL